jgi:hypothetical protein
MKKSIFYCLVIAVAVAGCKTKESANTAQSSSVQMPFTATYASNFTTDVPDSEVLTVLNSYKDWESGDLNALRSTMTDSQYFYTPDGFRFAGLTDSLMNHIKSGRDSLSSVQISMDAWTKDHSVKDNRNFVNVWYKETDTYKNGKVDSAAYEDVSGLKNGKIIYYSSHKRILKP